jgi:imidazolonepropionase-like amidohydrolase
MPGYALPLEYDGKNVTEFLLVPWVGACIHTPPPPPNQIVYAKAAQPFPAKNRFAPVWIEGRLQIGTETSIKMAKKHGIKIASGANLWGPAMDVGIATEFAARKPYFTNVEILRQATSINGELLRLTGELNPYPDGPIGIIAEGAYADILVIDGNPLEKIEILTDPDKNLRIIMKDGKIYKNTRSRREL